MKPSLGRTILVKSSNIGESNCTDVFPAIITRVWSENDPAEARGSFVCVNVIVFPDNAVPVAQGSISLFETADEAAASGSSHVGWWPSRK